MSTVGVVQARLASRRFPHKALADLDGHPVIWHVCTRVQAVPGLSAVALVCPESDADAFRAVVPPGVGVYPLQTVPVRWHEDGSVAAWDVLGAFAALVDTLKLRERDWLLRVTGDCPCWNPEVGRKILRCIKRVVPEEDYLCFVTADTTCSGWPDGFDAEAFTVADLRHAARSTAWPLDREHVTRWMRRNRLAVVVTAPEDRGHLTLSVNTPDDLTRVREYLHAQRYTAGAAHVDAS